MDEADTTNQARTRKRPPVLQREWEERLERLCRLTFRTSLILELCGLDWSERHRIKRMTARSYEEADSDVPRRPRGQAAGHGAYHFLETMAERYDATYLVAVHFPHGSGEFCESETHLGRALDKRIETYLQYLTHLHPGKQSGRVSFETYCELLNGIRCGGLAMHTCKECGARHPVPVSCLGTPVCPVCYVLRPKIDSFRTDFEQRLARHRCDYNAADALHEAG